MSAMGYVTLGEVHNVLNDSDANHTRTRDYGVSAGVTLRGRIGFLRTGTCRFFIIATRRKRR